MKRLLSYILTAAIICSFMLPAASAIEMKFTDVKEGDWFYHDVKLAVETGLVNGKGDVYTYAPNDYLTYSEVVKLAACMHERYMTGAVSLENSTTGEWYETYVAYARENGIITGAYHWTGQATRAGYMGIFANALPEKALSAINDVPDDSIPDVPMTSTNADAIYKLYRAGILQGIDDQFHCTPTARIMRSEVAAILTRMMNPAERKRFSIASETEKLVISSQPEDAAVAIGETMTVSVAVTGGREPYTYQWECQVDGTWDAILHDSAKTASLSFVPIKTGNEKVRCVVTDANGESVTTNTVALTVTEQTDPMSILTAPADYQMESAKEEGTFGVTIEGGKSPYTYEWYVRYENQDVLRKTETIAKVSSTFSVLFDEQELAQYGNIAVYCVITDSAENRLTTSPAFVVCRKADPEGLRITEQPTDVTVKQGETASMSVKVSGGTEPYAYQWQMSKDNTKWGSLTGKNASKIELDYIANLTLYYRCVITDADGHVIESDSAKYTGI